MSSTENESSEYSSDESLSSSEEIDNIYHELQSMELDQSIEVQPPIQLQEPIQQQIQQHQILEVQVDQPVNQPEWEVHSVIGHTLIDGLIYYKIRWAPLGEWLDSWEPSNQCACDTIIRYYYENLLLMDYNLRHRV